MKRPALITPKELALILETVESTQTVLRTKEQQALVKGEAKPRGVSPRMDRLVHRLSDRFPNLSEGAIRPVASKWFEHDKGSDDQKAILNRLDTMNRKARVLETADTITKRQRTE